MNDLNRKLTITSILNKKSFIANIGKLYPNYSLSDRLKIANNLPYIEEDCLFSDDDLEYLFSGIAEYSIKEIEPNYSCKPPWLCQNYLDAKAWVKSKPAEYSLNVDILFNSPSWKYDGVYVSKVESKVPDYVIEWYLNLNAEEQEQVDIIINANRPWA